MKFDIDKFVSIPRNAGRQYQNLNAECCTIGAAYYACGNEPITFENSRIVNGKDLGWQKVREWMNTLAKDHPFFMMLLEGAENTHMRSFEGDPAEATKTVIDALLMNRSILAAEGIEVVGTLGFVEKQLA